MTGSFSFLIAMIPATLDVDLIATALQSALEGVEVTAEPLSTDRC
jgi:hypothetical protein